MRKRSLPTLLALCGATLAFPMLSGCSDDNSCQVNTFKNRCLSLTLLETCQAGRITEVACKGTYFCKSDKVVGDRCFNPNLECSDSYVPACTEDLSAFTQCEKGQRVTTQCINSQLCRVKGGKPYCADSCNNGRLDKGESAIDCGGSCGPCAQCESDSDCKDGKLCDFSRGSVCTQPCMQDVDCKNFDNQLVCRADGLCLNEVFSFSVAIPSDNRSFVLPHDGVGDCNFKILWGDENQKDINQGTSIIGCKNAKEMKHEYKQAGNYTIRILGVYDGFGYADNAPDKSCEELCPSSSPIKEILSFGKVSLSAGAFRCTQGLKLPTGEYPEASSLKNLSHLFRCTKNFNQALAHWKMGKVEDLSYAFAGSTSYNQPLVWELPSLRKVEHLFDGASAFNANVSQLKLDKVSNIDGLFANASNFNQSLSGWNVSQITSAKALFKSARSFNQNLSELNFDNLQYAENMFENAEVFNSPLPKFTRLLKSTAMFKGAQDFDQNIGDWDMSYVTDSSSMFENASKFNANLSNWKTDKNTNTRAMFKNASRFDQNLSNWNMKLVTDAQEMFAGATYFKQDLSPWQLHSQVKLDNIFKDSGLNSDFYCKLKTLQIWKDQFDKLGLAFECP